MDLSTDDAVARFFSSMGTSPAEVTIFYRDHRVKAHASYGSQYGSIKLDVYGATTASYKDGRRGMFCKEFSRQGLEARIDEWLSGVDHGKYKAGRENKKRKMEEIVDRMWQNGLRNMCPQLCQFSCPSCRQELQAELEEGTTPVVCGACSLAFDVQKPPVSVSSVSAHDEDLLGAGVFHHGRYELPKPDRNGATWSAEEDREVWAVLGHFPRTANGYLSTANGVGRLVRQLADKYQRTEGAIKSRIEHHDKLRKPREEGRSPDINAAPFYTSPTTRSTAGWQSWPKPREGDYGLVYIVTLNDWGYYDDDEGPHDCIVYVGDTPMRGPAYMYRRHELRKPPFEGRYRAY